MDYSFHAWEKRRRHLAPEADRILPLVARSSGMTRKQIGHAVRLDRDILDELLRGMVEIGVLIVASENGVGISCWGRDRLGDLDAETGTVGWHISSGDIQAQYPKAAISG